MLLEHSINCTILENNKTEFFEEILNEPDSQKVPVMLLLRRT